MVSYYDLCRRLAMSLAIISVVCCLIVILIITSTKKKSGFLKVLRGLNATVLLNSVAIAFSIGNTTSDFCVAQAFLVFWTDISIAIWVMIIALVVCYIVYSRRNLDLHVLFFPIFAIAACLPLSVVIPGMYYHVYGQRSSISWCNIRDDDSSATTAIWRSFYVYFTASSMIVTYLAVGAVFIRLALNGKGNIVKAKSTPAESALNSLAIRLLFYPLVETILRSGMFLSVSKYSNDDSSIMVHSIFSPAVGIGYFIVFFLVQPGAWKTFRRLLGIDSSGEDKPLISHGDNVNSTGNISRTNSADPGVSPPPPLPSVLSDHLSFETATSIHYYDNESFDVSVSDSLGSNKFEIDPDRSHSIVCSNFDEDTLIYTSSIG